MLKSELKVPANRIDSAEECSAIEILRKTRQTHLKVGDQDGRWIAATAVSGDGDVVVTGDQDPSRWLEMLLNHPSSAEHSAPCRQAANGGSTAAVPYNDELQQSGRSFTRRSSW